MTKTIILMKIIAPIYITLWRKKYALNMNGYRNWHYRVNNALKIAYKQAIREQIEGKRIWEPYKMEMTLFYKRRADLDNIDAVISKFTNDALVEYWCVSDDNVEVFVEKLCKVWWKVKEPYMEIIISEYDKS